MQAGFQIEIRSPPLGSAPAKAEVVFVLADNSGDAVRLVRTALRLDEHEPISVTRILTEGEVKSLALKPFQVKHA